MSAHSNPTAPFPPCEEELIEQIAGAFASMYLKARGLRICTSREMRAEPFPSEKCGGMAAPGDSENSLASSRLQSVHGCDGLPDPTHLQRKEEG